MQDQMNNPVIKSIKNDVFGVTLVINSICNQKCSYCPPILHKGIFPQIESEIFINFFKNLCSDNPYIADRPQRKITITGGEPSLYKNVVEVMKCLKSLGFLIALNTNLNNNMEFWNTSSNYIDTLYPSFHPRYANIEHFKRVIDIFINKNKHVELHILMDPQHWDTALEASAAFFDYKNITVNHKGILDKNNLKKNFVSNYSEEQITFIKNFPSNRKYNINDFIEVEYFDGRKVPFNGQEILANKDYNFAGISCNAGKNALMIKENGTVWGSSCKARYFGDLHQTPNLRIKLFNTPVICHKNTCSILCDMKIQKSYA